MKKFILSLILIFSIALPSYATDQRIQSTEKMVGANHPSLSDTLNRLTLIGHNNDGSHRHWADIKEYGAVGNGVVDDTTAIQGAFDSGLPVLIPDGTYMVSGITVSGATTIHGSYNSVLKFIATATPAPIVTATGDGIRVIGGLRLDGNSTATYGWYHNGANNAEINSLFITGATSHNLYIKGVTGNGSYYNNWYNLISKSGGGSGVKIDGDINPDSRANVNSFFGGQISANILHGFELSNAKGTFVSGVSVETNGGYAYNFTTCLNQALTAIGGWIESNTNGGINIDATTKGVQFYGTRINQATEFAGAGINNGGNIFLLDNAGGVLTKFMELIGASLRGSYLRDALTDSFQTAGLNTLQTKASGDTYYRYQLTNSGGQYWGSGSGTSDVNMIRNSAGLLVSTKLMATGGLGAGNAVTNINTPAGATAKALPIYDNAGALLGYIPIYAAQW